MSQLAGGGGGGGGGGHEALLATSDTINMSAHVHHAMYYIVTVVLYKLVIMEERL